MSTNEAVHYRGNEAHGFTVAELVIVIAIICILAALAIAAYQTYTVRAQVSEGIGFAARTKAQIVDTYTANGVPPVGLLDAGLAPDVMDTQGSYLVQVDVVNGRIDVRFGQGAHAEIQAGTVSLTPYVTSDGEIEWRCGSAPAPDGTPLTGGGVTATHVPPTVDPRYLPPACR